jgi:hypothetical protein
MCFVTILEFIFLFSYLPSIKEDEIEEACSTNGDMINAYKILFGNLEEKRKLGRPRCRWEDNIKMDLKEISI